MTEDRAPRLHAKRIRSDEVFFSSRRFRAWCSDRFGVSFTEVQVARIVEVDRKTVHAYLAGTRQPTLNQLFRMAASAGVPIDCWLEHVVYKTPIAPPSGD